VRASDTLYGIAYEHGLDYRELARWNDIRNPDLIHAGALLRLRPPNAAEPAAPSAMEPPQADPASWAWPVRGRLIAGFNEAEGRKGIDIAAPHGTPIQASADGRVVYAGNGLRGYGKLVIIRHSKSLLSAYAHQARILVREGDPVSRGQRIGLVGDTDADRAKLHFEIRKFGRPVDPHDYLPS
jgi:lipoprotein NlpD